MLRSLLLGLMRRLGPDATLEIKIFLTRSENLTKPGAGQELETHSIRRPRVRMLLEHPANWPSSIPPLALLLIARFFVIRSFKGSTRNLRLLSFRDPVHGPPDRCCP